MGVKGLRSLLDADKRLYAERWVRSNDGNSQEGVNDVIYIDGPALLYHLIGSFWDMVFLDEFYNRAKKFISCLIKVKCREIHLVMEGLAGVEKMEEQISRIQKKMASCDDIAKQLIRRSNGSGYGKFDRRSNIVPHIFTEASLIKAFQNACNEAMQNTSLNDIAHPNFISKVHFAKGEAETAFLVLLRNKMLNDSSTKTSETRHYILSNDTDFMIYALSPGFVALDTVEIIEDQDIICISGYHFNQKQLCSAFDIPSSTLPICALLSGSDYTFRSDYEKRMNVLRQRIVSETVTLSRRKKSNPSYKAQLSAILQYLANITSSWSITDTEALDFSSKIALVLAGQGKGHDSRFSDLQCLFRTIMNVYGYLDPNDRVSDFIAVHVSTTFWTDIERMRKRNMFYWRPILERVDKDFDLKETDTSNSITSIYQFSKFQRLRRYLHRTVSANKDFIEVGRIKGYSVKVFTFTDKLEETYIPNLVCSSFKSFSRDVTLELLGSYLEIRNLSTYFDRLPNHLQAIFIAGILAPTASVRHLLCSCHFHNPLIDDISVSANQNKVHLDAMLINTMAALQLTLYHTVLIVETFQTLFENTDTSILSFFFQPDKIKNFLNRSKERLACNEFYRNDTGTQLLWKNWSSILPND